MKIAVVHPRMSVLGGAERVAIHSIRAGLRAGHRVSLISEQFDPSRVEQFFACEGLFSKVELLTYPMFRPRLVGSLILYRQLYYHHRRMREVLSKQSNFQLLLSTQDIGYVPSTSAHVIQYCYFPDYFSHIQTGPSRWWDLYYWPARHFYHDRVNHVDEFLSTSNYTRDSVKKVWQVDSTTLYPPCPVDLYESREQAKEDLVVTVARIVPEKRMEVFLEIARQMPSVKFVIVGRIQPGMENYHDLLRKSAPNNASLIDVPLREAGDLLARAKVYVHCARNEQFGITIVEAMAAGCVPVVHDSGGPKEIVTPKVGYRWVSVEEATEQIKVVLQDENKRQALSGASNERSKLFNTDRFENGLASVFEKYEG